MADGFLGRWSRRKLDAKEGKPLEPEPPRADAQPSAPSPVSAKESQDPVERVATSVHGEEGSGKGPAAPEPQQPVEPPPTLADVADLTPQSDFRRFIARDVAPDVKNAAMKKLFADPHFNVMDGLDTYIDDYSKPDPMPASMLRQLASAQFLGLFREEDRKDTAPSGACETTDGLGLQSVAQSGEPQVAPAAGGPAPVPVPESAPDAVPDAHADLRLQQDDAPEGGEPGHGAG
jgi:hypothetical protein